MTHHRSIRHLGAIATLAIVATVAAGCAQGIPADASPVATDQVSVVDSAFDARVVQVAPGATVTWTWRGSLPHDVAGDGWASEVQQAGTYEHTFATAGTFDYRCHVHDGMTGRVIVGN